MRAASVFRLETLGLDLLEGILSELTPREAVHARATCRVMRDACRNLERNAREGGRGRRHRCRVVVGCSRSSELVELDGTAFEATGRRAGAWVTTRHPKRPHDAWLTGVALDRASGDIFAARSVDVRRPARRESSRGSPRPTSGARKLFDEGERTG